MIVGAVNQGMKRAEKMMNAEIEKVTGGFKSSRALLKRLPEAAGSPHPHHKRTPRPMKTTDPITNLINALSKLPGIGERTASRLAFHIMNQPAEFAQDLADALIQVKARVGLCKRCCNLTEHEYCNLCTAQKRDGDILCVVESTPNLRAIENTGEFRGMYHVLHGLISPLEGVGPDDIRVAELLRRFGSSGQEPEPPEVVHERIKEVIIATSPSVDGEATALYLTKLLRPLELKITRIASGVPIGSELEYTDRMTLSRALLERREL